MPARARASPRCPTPPRARASSPRSRISPRSGRSRTQTTTSPSTGALCTTTGRARPSPSRGRSRCGAARNGRNGQVVSLVVGRKIAEVELPGLPHLGSGIVWDYRDTTVLATPNLKEGVVSVIDLNTWKTVKRIDTLGPGFFMRSHEQTPYAWVDVFFGPNRDAMHVIDKKTLEIVKTLRPEPGKRSEERRVGKE